MGEQHVTEGRGERPRSRRVLRAPCVLAVVLAAIFFDQSLEPSLMARAWYFQGAVSGVAVAVGYGIGVGLTRLGRWLRDRRGWGLPPFAPETDLRVRAGVFAATLVYVVWNATSAAASHEWTWERLGYERGGFWYVYGGTLLITAVLAGVLMLVARGVRLLWLRTTRVGRRWLPAAVAGGLALVLVAWVVLASLNGLVLQRTLDGFNATFAAGDRDLDDAPEPPTSALRSGGPASELDWAGIGREGRLFLTRGPAPDKLEELAPDEIVEPIRVFVGRASADDTAARVAMAMEELERFGAFDREAVLVVVPTGTGWVNEQIVQPLEFFHSGDIATVAVQYSHLPIPLAFLAEADAAGELGAALVGAVRDRLDAIGPDAPTFYVAGESLGSYGGAQAFTSLADSRDTVDGALWVGPPAMMHLRREAERVRHPESPQISPQVGDGEDFVFANRVSDLVGTEPHSVFLQQADDAIVWWDAPTLWSEPDWLEEPLDAAVNPEMSWSPLTTFLQLAVDMAVGIDFDEDHGHKYGTQPLAAWRVIVQPEGWDEERVERLRAQLEMLVR